MDSAPMKSLAFEVALTMKTYCFKRPTEPEGNLYDAPVGAFPRGSAL